MTEGFVSVAEGKWLQLSMLTALSTVEDAEIVIPAVFLYRLVTFWLPILPGWIALTWLRNTDRILSEVLVIGG